MDTNFGQGVYLTMAEWATIKSVLEEQRQQIKHLESEMGKLIKEQQENITGVGQC